MASSSDRHGFNALKQALAGVVAVASADSSYASVNRIRKGLREHAEEVEAARASHDPIRLPRASFDPSDPKTVGRIVSLALLAQPSIPLASVRPAYGSGVYAIYYRGDHPLYAMISHTETPIYVGKADPEAFDASTTREQGAKLTGRLLEHAGTIATAENYAADGSRGIFPIRLADFHCRALVCATNAQLVAEQHLIRMFWPLWNAETKACWGMSKHGDAAKTRANKRSPWDVAHPGRAWALASSLVDSLSLSEIRARIEKTLMRAPPRLDYMSLLGDILSAFRQSDSPPADKIDPPVGADARGPEEDEAGGRAD